MGNIRPTYIKRVAIEIEKKFPDMVSDDFDTNKELVAKMTDVPTKKMRNRIAGYLTTYHRLTVKKNQ